MGLMPRTAQSFGVSLDRLDDPEESVRAAAELIRLLNRSFSDISDETERLQMVLEAYNTGLGNALNPDHPRSAAIDKYVIDVMERWQKYQGK
jgi:membrane-bound lytic murein transglycosylase F